MGVKTIFKVLIGTIAILLLSMVVIEYINVATFSYQINQLTRLSVKKACDFYSKETYKSNVGLLRDIVGASGNNVIGGNIYDYNTDEEIYNSLYTNSSDFINWYSQHSGIWDNLDLLAYGLNIGGKIVDGEDALIAKYMADTQVTPINLGVTYLDKDSIEKVTKWNLTAIISNGLANNIIDNSSDGRVYTKYKGFRVYTTEAQITGIDYRILDINNDVSEIKNLTRLENLDSMEFENSKFVVAGITYSIPIAYEGVTPLENVIRLTNEYRVKGIANRDADKGNQTHLIKSENLEGGGFSGSSLGSLPIKGELTFIVTRCKGEKSLLNSIVNVFKKRDKDENGTTPKGKDKKDICILTEKNKEYLKEYLDAYDVNVKVIFSDIEDAKVHVLTINTPIRLIIMEYGMGRFSSSANKEDLMDLIGMCESDENDVIVYYTRETLKSKGGKVTWIKLKNTGEVVDDIINYY